MKRSIGSEFLGGREEKSSFDKLHKCICLVVKLQICQNCRSPLKTNRWQSVLRHLGMTHLSKAKFKAE